MEKRSFIYGLLLVLTGLHSYSAKAQQTLKIGTNPTTVSNSAVLDVNATNKGVLLPRIALTGATDITTITAPANALTIFNTATAGTAPYQVVPGYYFYSTTNLKWIKLFTNDDVSVWGTKGNAGTDPAVNYIGTTDGAALNFKLGGLAAGRLSSSNTLFGEYTYYGAPNSNVINTAFGRGPLALAPTGTDNALMGENIMPNASSGSRNVGVGINALYQTNSNQDETAIGHEAGRLLQSTYSSNTVAIGSYAFDKRYGKSSISLGSEAFHGTASSGGGSSDFSIGIGYRAGYYEARVGRLHISNAITSLPLIFV